MKIFHYLSSCDKTNKMSDPTNVRYIYLIRINAFSLDEQKHEVERLQSEVNSLLKKEELNASKDR